MSRNAHNNFCINKQGKMENTLCYAVRVDGLPLHKTKLVNAVNLKDYEPIRTAPWSWIYTTNDVQWNCGIGIIWRDHRIEMSNLRSCNKTWKIWAWRRFKPRRALPYMWTIKPCNSFQVYFYFVRDTNRTPIWPSPRWFDSLVNQWAAQSDIMGSILLLTLIFSQLQKWPI